MKKLITGLATLLIMAFTPAVAFAHVIVTPNQAGIGQELVFSVSVPNERQTIVTNIKLLIPNNVTNVIPTSKSGWAIKTTSNGNTANPEITSIIWTGDIPVGERNDFSFSAQVPANPTELDWKAYQTYADGTVVHWDQKPAGNDDSTGNAGPYSVTKVVNDLNNTAAKSTTSSSANLALAFSLIAVIFSAASLIIRKKK